MPRKKKDNIPVEYYLRNCHRCTNCNEMKIIINGKDNGTVVYVCTITNEYVMPHRIDGCKNYNYGVPTFSSKEKTTEKQ